MKLEPECLGERLPTQNSPSLMRADSEQSRLLVTAHALNSPTSTQGETSWWETGWFKEWERMARPKA